MKFAHPDRGGRRDHDLKCSARAGLTRPGLLIQGSPIRVSRSQPETGRLMTILGFNLQKGELHFCMMDGTRADPRYVAHDRQRRPRFYC